MDDQVPVLSRISMKGEAEVIVPTTEDAMVEPRFAQLYLHK